MACDPRWNSASDPGSVMVSRKWPIKVTDSPGDARHAQEQVISGGKATRSRAKEPEEERGNQLETKGNLASTPTVSIR